MSMNIYAAITRTSPRIGAYMGPVIEFDCWDPETLAEDADARAERGESAFIPNPDYVENAGMNLANDNARALLDAIGLPLDDEGFGQFPIDEAQRACLRGLNDPSAEASSETRLSGAAVGEPGPTIVACGRPEDYMREKLVQLSAVIATGRRHGATHLVVC